MKGADGAGFDPSDRTAAFSSNGRDGTLTVVSKIGGKFEPTTIATVRGARTMTIDTKTHKIYMPGETCDFAPAVESADKKPGRPRMVPRHLPSGHCLRSRIQAFNSAIVAPPPPSI